MVGMVMLHFCLYRKLNWYGLAFQMLLKKLLMLL